MNLTKLYDKLLKKHGYQGWWPINGIYRPKDYSYPKNENEIFEIITGVILTQNTSWKNVEKCLYVLRGKELMNAENIIKINSDELAMLIKSSGYYNQKAKKLKLIAEFLSKNKGVPKRDELLKVWGIGKESADSILLYAYKQPYFIIDNYTKRVVGEGEYDKLQEIFHSSLPVDYKIYNEFHALIVAEGKSLS